MTDPFDRQELLEELDGDIEFLAESVEILEEDAPKLLLDIRSAIDAQDAQAAATAAHTLKSMVGNFCASSAYEAALQIETDGKAGDLSGCRTGLTELEHEIERLQAALAEFLQETERAAE